ncbi:hypothetical protein LPJ57_005215 [Coemansia sp. RSA 486]|nr:hypothetical protein LPJ57_005215 [Coemansia sp. RSA 486]
MSGAADPNSRFISETDIQEARSERATAWQKAYESGQTPTDADSTYDPRTLYERLQEQRRRKEDAYAESRRHANLVHKLDPDESEFLETVDDQEHQKIADQRHAELVALAKFKDEVAETQEQKNRVAKKRKLADTNVGMAGRGGGQKSVLDRIATVVVKSAVKVDEVESKKVVGEGDHPQSDANGGDDVDDKEVLEGGALGGLLAAYQGVSDSESDDDSGSESDNKGSS